MADGSHFEKPINRNNSVTFCLITTKFGTYMKRHIGPICPIGYYSYEHLKI